MGKLCFESVTKLIGQLILLAKYGGPEVRDVKCSQRDGRYVRVRTRVRMPTKCLFFQAKSKVGN